MKPYYETEDGKIYHGDALAILKQLPDESVHCCVTSPPYWGLRDYGVDGQLGLEKTPEEYVSKMVQIFSEVKRVLRNDGTLWLNMGDSYWSDTLSRKDPVESMWGNRPASDLVGGRNNIPKNNVRGGLGERPKGLKPKDLCGIPWMLAFALRADGWYLRSDIIWHKPNPMPESVTDRPTKAHEYMFLLSKSAKYFYDADAIKEDSTYPNDDRVARADETQKRMPTEKVAGIRPKLKTPSGWDTGPGGHGTIHSEGRMQVQEYTNNCYPKRNKRTVWTIPTQPMPDAHFATFPKKLIEPCILAGSPKGGTVLDLFFGSGTTGLVAYRHDRKFVGIELSKTYLDNIAIPRIENERKQLKLFQP